MNILGEEYPTRSLHVNLKSDQRETPDPYRYLKRNQKNQADFALYKVRMYPDRSAPFRHSRVD
jgi:hypothetical protein